MSNSKSWIQIFKNHWAKSGLALGWPWFEKGKPAGFGILNSVFEIGHKYDLKCFCAINYHSWRFVLVRIFLSCFFMANFLISYFLNQIKAGPLSAQWFFKTWIQLLKLLINLIRNASVCSSIILKNLYWSEFGFLVSLWLNFHFFVFFRFQIFWEWAGSLFSLNQKIWSRMGRPWPAHSEKSWDFWSWILKNFFFAFYERLSFFDGKYGYLTTFD